MPQVPRNIAKLNRRLLVKSVLYPLTEELHEVFGFAFKVLFHNDACIQSLDVIPQVNCFRSTNAQSSAYCDVS